MNYLWVVVAPNIFSKEGNISLNSADVIYDTQGPKTLMGDYEMTTVSFILTFSLRFAGCLGVLSFRQTMSV